MIDSLPALSLFSNCLLANKPYCYQVTSNQIAVLTCYYRIDYAIGAALANILCANGLLVYKTYDQYAIIADYVANSVTLNK